MLLDKLIEYLMSKGIITYNTTAQLSFGKFWEDLATYVFFKMKWIVQPFDFWVAIKNNNIILHLQIV